MAVIDAQSVKTSENVAETSQGVDAGKKIKGRKRHLITDTLGLVLAVLITAANVHDTTGGRLLLDDVAANHPSVSRSGPTVDTRTASSITGPCSASTWRWCSDSSRGVRAAAETLGDRADLRLADAAPAPGPGLRSPAPEIPGNDPLGDG